MILNREARALRPLFGAVVLMSLATLAAAQSAEQNSSSTISEVIVTARHRAEDIQDVPVAVSVVSGAQADSANLNDIGDISSEVPSVDFRTGASNKDRTIFIRGIGTISTSPGVEPSVSMVVDGVVYARPGMATLDLMDIDHIEVLQGPQGTLFGKNASAGVINVVTDTPTDVSRGYAEVSAFEGDEYRAKAGLSGALIPGELDGLISAFDGYYLGNVLDLRDGKEVNGYRHTGARTKLVATPSDDLRLTLAADYTNSMDTTPTGVFTSASQIAYPTGVVTTNANLAHLLSSVGITPSADNRVIDDSYPTSVEDKNGGVSLQADWKLAADYTLTSISAYRNWNNVQFQDYDQLPFPTVNFGQGNDTGNVAFNQESEELRIASPKGHAVDFVAGLYFLRAEDAETYDRLDTILIDSLPAYSAGLGAYGTLEKNFAPFGEADINFTSRFRGIVGYREIFDWLSYYDSRVSTIVGSPPGIAPSVVNGPGSIEKTGYADRLGVQYDLSHDLTTYFTYSRGYKGPAYNVFFNMAAVNTPPLAPETSDAYEIGLKGDLFEHRLQANLAGFITDFHNYQANFTQVINGGLATNLINAGSVSTKGVEGDVTARATRSLSFTANFIYDEAVVDNFPCPPGAPLSCNIDGQPLPFAPRWKIHAEGDYRIPVSSSYDFDVETDYNWQTAVQYQLTETPNTIQPAYGIWNASIGLLGTSSGWQARFLVKNILDQHYSPYLSGGTLAGTVRWVPRDDDTYVGVILRKDF